MNLFKVNLNEMPEKSFKFKDKEAQICLKFMIDLIPNQIKRYPFKKTQQQLFKEESLHIFSFKECVSKITRTRFE